ncbi:MAG: short-chain dehydrogenase/reductase [Verrucomicrobiaceae bacterium]|nr:short-chain dehydrogenase/reductase [Verrucomicrobiaceae bacterium]
MKRALVTGGSGGIGAAICRQLARDKFFVFVHANSNIETARKIVDEIIAAGGSARAIQFDITQRDSTETVLNELLEEAPIQVIVNNAGVTADTVFPAMSAAQWHRVIDVSLHGFFHVTHPLLMPMLRTRWGRIINITSVAAQIGNRGQVNYAAAKGALQSATKALALEVASRGVTVNAVAPGIIESAMTESVFDEGFIARVVPLQRSGRPQEVAALVAFLASDQAGYITGQTISINGGMA